jgi:hypothetical protein
MVVILILRNWTVSIVVVFDHREPPASLDTRRFTGVLAANRYATKSPSRAGMAI